MSDIKVGSGGGVHSPRIERSESTGGARDVVGGREELPSSSAATDVVSARPAGDPAALVERIRTGEIDVDTAVTEIIDDVLASNPALAASESLRRDARRVLSELVQGDPTLYALSSAMKR